MTRIQFQKHLSIGICKYGSFLCKSLSPRFNVSISKDLYYLTLTYTHLYFQWNTKQMNESSKPSFSRCPLLTRREVLSGGCHQTLSPKTKVTRDIRCLICSALCIVHNVQADGGVSEILAMTTNTISTVVRYILQWSHPNQKQYHLHQYIGYTNVSLPKGE